MDLSQYAARKNKIRVLSRKNLSQIGQDVLTEYMPQVLKYPVKTDIEALIEDVFCLDIIDASIYRDKEPVIGMCAFFDGKHLIKGETDSYILDLHEGNIVIEESLRRLKKYHRMRNTMAHELSHWILHRDYFTPVYQDFSFRKEGIVACRENSVNRDENGKTVLKSDHDWLEFQANCLGASLLMPEKTFREAFREECLDNHIPCDYMIYGKNRIAQEQVTRSLMNVFEVSRPSTLIRLKELGLMVYESQNRAEVV